MDHVSIQVTEAAYNGIPNASISANSKWISGEASPDIANATWHMTVPINDLRASSETHRNESVVFGLYNGSRYAEAKSQHENRQHRLASHAEAADCLPKLFEPQVSYRGWDTLVGALDRPAVDAAACCHACISSPPCTHWTWLQNGCSIKHGHLSPAKLHWAPDVISGRVPLNIRVERLWESQNPEEPILSVRCLREEVEDDPLFIPDPLER
jgi:hypothetical protein